MSVKNTTKAIKCYKNGNKNWLKDDVWAVSVRNIVYNAKITNEV